MLIAQRAFNKVNDPREYTGEIELKNCLKITENVPTRKYKNVFSMVQLSIAQGESIVIDTICRTKMRMAHFAKDVLDGVISKRCRSHNMKCRTLCVRFENHLTYVSEVTFKRCDRLITNTETLVY